MSAEELPFSQAAENNRGPILAQLQRLLAKAQSVLEIGSGTGQHAVAFAEALPQLSWQPTEHPSALAQLRPRCTAAGLSNLLPPQPLDILDRPWRLPGTEVLYTANTLHIVARPSVEALFSACASLVPVPRLILVYGPFNYRGQYTSDSNARFDAWLHKRDPESGIRDVEWVNALAVDAGYVLREDIAMPANNRLLAWERVT